MGKGRYSSEEIEQAVAAARRDGWNVLRLPFETTDQDVRALLAEDGVGGLTQVDLTQCGNLTDAAVEALAKGCPGLMQVNLWNCGNLTDAAVVALAKGCPGLTQVNLWNYGNLTDAAVVALAKGCPGLTQVSLWKCGNLTDAAVAALALGCPGLTQVNLLRCKNLTDAAVAALAERCPGLTQVDVGGCENLTDAAALAKCLKPLKKLTTLYLHCIPGLRLPDEVVKSRNPARILAALEEIAAGQTAPVLEVKLVLLGNGRAGKSQLANRLRGKPFVKGSASTLHFEVHRLPLEGVRSAADDGKPQTVAGHLYDFGGQPHLWSAHRFFLASQHNLYVVVIDGTREGLPQLRYWLEYIRHYARPDASDYEDGEWAGGADRPEARGRPGLASVRARTAAVPVLAVFSQSDCAKAERSEGREAFRTPDNGQLTALCEQYADVIDLRVVRRYSSSTDEGLDGVRGHLHQLVGRMRYIFDTQYPKGLHEVKDYLRGEQESVAGRKLAPFAESMARADLYKLFRAAAAEQHKPDDGRCEDWLQMLRNLGVVHWVGDLGPKREVRSGAAIAETVYQPEWVQKLVYAIVAAEPGDKTPTGVADEAKLCQLMCRKCGKHTEGGPPGQPCHRAILDLMQACELIFAPPRSSEYLVLDWIADARGHSPAGRPALAEVVFERFLPESLLVRCAGQWYADLNKLDDDLCRNLVRVCDPADEDIQVEVKADVFGRRITLRSVDGAVATMATRRFAELLKRDILRMARDEGLEVPALRENPVVKERKVSTMPPTPAEVFISYSHKDEKLREKLGAHLSLLKREGVISVWHDRRITAGAEWKGKIDEHLNSCSVVLLLISADFVASDYCYDVEMKHALERHDGGEARVIPVVLKPVDWQSAPFAKLQALPKDGKPVTKWANREEALADVAKGIRAAIASANHP